MLEKYTFEQLDHTDLSVYNCGAEDCRPGHRWGPGVRDHFIIHLVIRGRGRFGINGIIRSLDPGQIFLIPANCLAEYEADQQEPWSYLWLGFKGLRAEGLCREAGLSENKPVKEISDLKSLQKLITEMLGYAGGSREHELHRLSVLYRFFALLIEANEEAGEVSPQTRQLEYLRQAIRYVAANYSGPLSVRGMADHVGLDRSYLYTLFQRHLQITPKRFLTQFRINKACELLYTGLTIGEVAYSVGYDDALLFSKVFKKEKGITPSHYRQKRANDFEKKQ